MTILNIVPTGHETNPEKALKNKGLTQPSISGPYTRPYTSSDFLQKTTLFPPELAHLVEVWPRPPEKIRQKIYDIALDALKDVEERPAVGQNISTEKENDT